MMRRAGVLLLIAMTGLAAACSTAEAPIRDPIPDIPVSQQRAVARTDFAWRWPFSIGHGTLGCADAAIVFRYEGRTYALNDTARSRGFAIVDPIWRWQASGMPSDPLRRLSQEQRQRIFTELMACEGDGSVAVQAQADVCKKRLAGLRGLTEPELKQISVEGRERLWDPLKRERASLEPLIEAGRQLCRR
jgi:hypothetical protein